MFGWNPVPCTVIVSPAGSSAVVLFALVAGPDPDGIVVEVEVLELDGTVLAVVLVVLELVELAAPPPNVTGTNTSSLKSFNPPTWSRRVNTPHTTVVQSVVSSAARIARSVANEPSTATAGNQMVWFPVWSGSHVVARPS